ncbi:ribonuclease H-like domain-containing protein, partial [Tanacetum coccineum]
NGNSWVSVPQTTQENGSTVIKNSVPVTTEEKINKKNDVKARSLLLTALPNEHLLTFSKYGDAKILFDAIKTRFGESLDSIFNRLQKIVSRLAILGVVITPEDLNSKFLRSLPPEWNTHVVVWMNKADIETMSIDDLECRVPRNKDDQFRYQDNSRNQESPKRTVNVEDTSSKAMLAMDGVGFDWSDMAEEQVNTAMPRVVNTARPYRAPVNTVRAIGLNDVNPSACWVWKPTRANGASLGNSQLNDKGFMCDKKNYVLFIDTECLVLSPNFKLPDESHILLRIPREDNMYSFDMKNIAPKESLTCLVAKATSDESMLWHRRLGHINFKNINKLVKENLVCVLLAFGLTSVGINNV